MTQRTRTTPQRRLTAEDRRVQLLEAAREVFLADGLNGARTRRIAEVAGVNEALLYQHFSSKDEIFEQAVIEPLNRIAAKVIDAGAELPDFDAGGQSQRQLTEAFLVELLTTMMDVMPLIGAVLFSDRSTGTRFYRTTVDALVTAITDVVSAAFPTWPHRDFDARTVTVAVLGTCMSLALDSHFGGEERDIPATATQLVDVIFYGLSADPSGEPE
jgi:AcrR family transcriptional regulator